MSKPLLIVGAGGHAKVLIETLRKLNCSIMGATCLNAEVNHEILGVKIIGADSVIGDYKPDDIELVNAIGKLPKQNARTEIFQYYKQLGYKFKTIIDPDAIVAASAIINEGAQIMAGAIIQACVVIGENSIVNTRASIDHDCRIGRHCHIAPGATLCGNITLADDVFIGAGATLIQGLNFERHSIVPAGSVMTAPAVRLIN